MSGDPEVRALAVAFTTAVAAASRLTWEVDRVLDELEEQVHARRDVDHKEDWDGVERRRTPR